MLKQIGLDRIVRAVVLVEVIGIIVLAGSILFDPPPPYRTDIERGVWTLISIDGHVQPPPAPQLAFRGDGMTWTSDCQTITGDAVRDSDGSMMLIGGFRVLAARCSPQQDAAERALLDALATTETWSVETEDLIVLRGGRHSITLARIPS